MADQYAWFHDEEGGALELSLEHALESAAYHFGDDLESSGEHEIDDVTVGLVRWLNPFKDGDPRRAIGLALGELLARLNEDVEIAGLLDLDAFNVRSGLEYEAKSAFADLLGVWLRAYVSSPIYTADDTAKSDTLRIIIRDDAVVAYSWGEHRYPDTVSWAEALKRLLSEQSELPADAREAIAENLWDLYDEDDND